MMRYAKLMHLQPPMRTPEYVLVIGTRPEAIKCTPLVSAFSRRSMRARLLVVFSGQQPELLESALPQVHMDIRMPEWPHTLPRKQRYALVCGRLRDLFVSVGCGPATHVIVQGDTSTSYLAALAAQGVRARVCHVEAGLRSGCLHSPFPEEFHRRAIARIASVHYAPTEGARDNLLREGIPERAILVTGNTGIDNLTTTLNGHAMEGARHRVLICLHRRENHGDPLHRIMASVLDLAARFPRFEFTWITHSNPAVAGELADYGPSPAPNVSVVGPMPYELMLREYASLALVMTDSGGMQEEAAHLGIPLLVLRDRTERPEALHPERGLLCPPADNDGLLDKFDRLIGRERKPRHVFGDGTAAERIVEDLLAQTLSPK